MQTFGVNNLEGMECLVQDRKVLQFNELGPAGRPICVKGRKEFGKVVLA